jgi:long-subunit acyl-CoA synthetase (AMP-forming)
MQCQALRKIIHEGIEAANAKAISRAQKISKFTILPVEFSVDGGELTPTMKLKRKVINEKYKAEIETLYI